jgi:hypothetical protein
MEAELAQHPARRSDRSKLTEIRGIGESGIEQTKVWVHEHLRPGSRAEGGQPATPIEECNAIVKIGA